MFQINHRLHIIIPFIMAMFISNSYSNKYTNASLEIESNNQNIEMGTQRKNMEAKIVGGVYTSILSFPHAVFLVINSYYTCGSSILNQVILITAAHCLKPNAGIFAIAGATNHEKATHAIEGKSFAMHPYYSPSSAFADIAVILLKNSLIFGLNIKRVAIKPWFPKNPEDTITGPWKYKKAYVAGWGAIEKNENKLLKHVNKTILRDDLNETEDDNNDLHNSLKCLEQIMYPIDKCIHGMVWYHGMLCSRQKKDNHPYRGDSGSGLVLRDRRHHLIGVVCGGPTVGPTDWIVYTDVSYFYGWIKKKSEELYCEE